MTTTIEILRGELERLFSLEEMTSMSSRMLGLDPKAVGGATAKGSFAKALTEQCVEGDRIEALVDVILASRQEVDPRVRDVSGLLGSEEFAPGSLAGNYLIERKIAQSEFGIAYLAKKDGKAFTVKTLRREASRDRGAVHRCLTAARLVSTVKHPGLPASVDAGEFANGIFYVAYEHVENAETLASILARTGPSHLADLRPVLRAILEPLAALHQAHLMHGDLKLEHVLVQGDLKNQPRVRLIDFGGDRLRPRLSSMKGGFLAIFGSPRSIAPEQVRGLSADSRTDVYAFGTMVYELLTGKPVFQVAHPADAAFMHLSQMPEPPSARAPKGWIPPDIDDWVLSMLHKDPTGRPRDAIQLLAGLDRLGGLARSSKGVLISADKLDQLFAVFRASPEDEDTAMALEASVDQGANPNQIAEVFYTGADTVPEMEGRLDVQKSLLFRAARIFDGHSERARAEMVYARVLQLDPSDEIARSSLESVRKALGKYEDVLEMLLERSEAAPRGEERARVFAEIGRLCSSDLSDAEQALVAYTQALAEVPSDADYADEVERLAGSDAQRWAEVAQTLSDGASEGHLSGTERNRLLERVGRIYETKMARPDLALAAYQQVLATDPASEAAHDGLANIYRKAQQWPELVQTLLMRSNAAGSTPRARDARSEAAELLESRLNDPMRAKEIYESILAEDPGHRKAGDQVASILEKVGDFQGLIRLLELRVEARRGPEKADAMSKIAEVFEDHLNDLTTATQKFEEALAFDPSNMNALKGLDRIFNRTGKYHELLGVLERQIAVAATPRQKINLFERLAALYDEEFLNYERATETLERVLQIDPKHESAITNLARQYKQLNRYEELATLYDHHARLVGDEAKKIELLLAKGRVYAESLASPERATKTFEEVLTFAPSNASALEALAHLREKSGDAHAALSAIESLAAKATTAEGKAEQWLRAARLLESRGDRDGAIERYKLALESNPKDPAAPGALRAAYLARGDYNAVLDLLTREIGTVDGNLARARLYAEMGKLYFEKLEDVSKAEGAAKKALEFDATNADAQLLLGDIAYDRKHYMDAQKAYAAIVGRTGVLQKEDAIRVLVRYVESVGKTDRAASQANLDAGPVSQSPISVSKISTAVDALSSVASEDVETTLRIAKVVLEHGDPGTARRMYETLLSTQAKHMKSPDRSEALYGLGESMRLSGAIDESITPLREAVNVDPSNTRPLVSLGKVYESKENWPEVLRMKKRQLDVAKPDGRFELLVEIGDVFFHKLGDRSMALKTFAAALEERPDDRNLLTRLLQLYTEEKDWAKLVEVVLRLADFVDDSRQRAKYMQTAAIVSARQLGQPDVAIEYFDRALEYDPSLPKALDEAVELRRKKGDHIGIERLLKMQLEQAKASHDRPKLAKILGDLGNLYHKFLNEPELAIDAFEAAQAFDPDNKDREVALSELYAGDPAQHLDKAVRSQAMILRKNPYRVESYKLLRKLYTDARKADGAWCLCQALTVLNLADPDEERFFKRHRAENAAPAQAVLDEADWLTLAHEDMDGLLTKLFAMIQPTIVKARTQPLESLGYEARYALDITKHPYPASQTLFYAAGVLGITAPLVFQNPNEPGGFGFVHASTASIVLGRSAFDTQASTQALAFVAGRHLSYFRPGHYVRHLVPTGTGLKAWLFAAIKHCVPQFPIAGELMGQVNEALAFLAADFQGGNKDRLASLVSKILQSGGALDLKRWVGSIDMTADRVGFLLAYDLEVSTEVVRATEGDSSIPSKERLKELVLFSVSEGYMNIREKLGISVAGK